MSNAREDLTIVLNTIEAQGESQDAMFQRAYDALADMKADREALETLARHQMDTRLARSSFVVEAAFLNLEHVGATEIRRRRLFDAMFGVAS